MPIFFVCAGFSLVIFTEGSQLKDTAPPYAIWSLHSSNLVPLLALSLILCVVKPLTHRKLKALGLHILFVWLAGSGGAFGTHETVCRSAKQRLGKRENK